MADSLLYDAEIEWLYSDGSAYIDTGINADGDLSVEFEYRMTNATNAAISGAIYNYNGAYYRHHFSPQNGGFFWYYNNSVGIGSTEVNSFHRINFNTTLGVLKFDNQTTNFTKVTFDCHCGYGIFARLSSNMAVQSKPSYFKYVKLSKNGVLLRDFIPVRVGTTGYMYDKVSGQLFGNAGSGSFVLGNDI